MSKQNDANVRAAETAEMQAVVTPTVAPAARKSDDEKMHIVWRVFGGAILSVTAFAGFTLYNTLTSSIAELRSEVSRLNEVKAEVKVESAKKEDVAALRTRAEDNRRELDNQRERLAKYRQELDAASKEQAAVTAGVKKDLTTVEKELQKALAEVREKLARLEGQQQQTPMKAVEK